MAQQEFELSSRRRQVCARVVEVTSLERDAYDSVSVTKNGKHQVCGFYVGLPFRQPSGSQDCPNQLFGVLTFLGGVGGRVEREIGRASCRERVERTVGGVLLRKNSNNTKEQ